MNNITALLKYVDKYSKLITTARSAKAKYNAAFELGLVAEDLKNEITGGVSQARFVLDNS